MGNAAFHHQVQLHNKPSHHSDKIIRIPADKKLSIIEAAAKACAIDTLPLSFCENRKAMDKFSKSLLQLGQSYSSSAIINIPNLLQCGKTTRRGVIALALKMKEDFKKDCHLFFNTTMVCAVKGQN